MSSALPVLGFDLGHDLLPFALGVSAGALSGAPGTSLLGDAVQDGSEVPVAGSSLAAAGVVA
jgi:hypothetical protein